jgi:hypothetical protein
MAKNEEHPKHNKGWTKDAPKTVEIGCMNRTAHHNVPYWFTAVKGQPATCPGCGRGA